MHKIFSKFHIKIILLCGLIAGLVIICISVGLYLKPKSIIKNGNTCRIKEIRYKNNSFRGEDIEICSQQIISVLSQYKCKPSFQKMRPYSSNDIVVSIDTRDMANGKLWNILLGDINLCYEYADSYICNIIDADKLLEEIEKIIANNLPVPQN